VQSASGLSALQLGGYAALAAIAIAGAAYQTKLWNEELAKQKAKWEPTVKAEEVDALSHGFEGLNSKLGEYQSHSAAVAREGEGMTADMKAGADAVDAIQAAMERYKAQVDAITSATGVSGDVAVAWLAKQQSLGHEFETTGEAVTAYTGKVDTSTMTATEAADAMKQQQEALKNLNDELHASVDPLFGMQRALRANEDAQRGVTDAQVAAFFASNAYTEAVRLHGEGSAEAATALRDFEDAQRAASDANTAATTSALDVTAAANTLKFAVDNGTLSIQGAKEQLAIWVYQGLITQATADDMAAKFGIVAGKADELNNKDVTINTTAPGADHVISQFDTLIDRLNSLNVRGVDRVLQIIAAGGIPGNDVGYATGGTISSGETATVGEQGPELYRSARGAMRLLTGPYFSAQDSGWIYTAAQTSRLMAGGGMGGGGSSYVDHSDRSVSVTMLPSEPTSPYAVANAVAFQLAVAG
jgi:hypothetical protein